MSTRCPRESHHICVCKLQIIVCGCADFCVWQPDSHLQMLVWLSSVDIRCNESIKFEIRGNPGDQTGIKQYTHTSQVLNTANPEALSSVDSFLSHHLSPSCSCTQTSDHFLAPSWDVCFSPIFVERKNEQRRAHLLLVPDMFRKTWWWRRCETLRVYDISPENGHWI